MPEFAKISGPKQNKLRGKSGKPLYLPVVEGIRGEFGMLPFPFLRTDALYFSRILLWTTSLSSGGAGWVLMFPFVFPTLPLSLPFTSQIVASSRQEQPVTGSHRGHRGGAGGSNLCRQIPSRSLSFHPLPSHSSSFCPRPGLTNVANSLPCLSLSPCWVTSPGDVPPTRVKASSQASTREAIKISDSTDNCQGHQLKGTLLSDNQGFIDFKNI